MTVYGGKSMGFSGSEGIKRNNSQAINDIKKSFDSQANSKRKDNQTEAVVTETVDSPAAQVSVSSRSVVEGPSENSSFQSAVDKVGGILEQVAELAIPSSNSTGASTEKEVAQLKAEVSKQGSNTEVEVSNPEEVSVSSEDANEQASSIDISSQARAQNAVDLISEATTSVTALKGSFGAAQSKLESTDSSLQTQNSSTEKAASPIRNLEVAKEVTENLAAEIRQSTAATALASFKNINAQAVSKLLQ
jgi:flagellin